jgi:hypothetical protein
LITNSTFLLLKINECIACLLTKSVESPTMSMPEVAKIVKLKTEGLLLKKLSIHKIWNCEEEWVIIIILKKDILRASKVLVGQVWWLILVPAM